MRSANGPAVSPDDIAVNTEHATVPGIQHAAHPMLGLLAGRLGLWLGTRCGQGKRWGTLGQRRYPISSRNMTTLRSGSAATSRGAASRESSDLQAAL